MNTKDTEHLGEIVNLDIFRSEHERMEAITKKRIEAALELFDAVECLLSNEVIDTTTMTKEEVDGVLADLVRNSAAIVNNLK